MKLVSKALYSSLLFSAILGCSVATPDVIAVRDDSKEDVSEKPNDFAVFNPRVDILFVIDNSGSMGEPQAELARNAQVFADAMSKATILDYHIGITSTDMSGCNNGMSCGQLYGIPTFVDKNTPNLVDNLSRRMVLGTNGDVTETMFAPTIAALSPNMEQGPNAGFYRKEAFLAVIFITDAADQSKYSPKDLLTFLQNKKGDPAKVLSYGVIRKLAEKNTCTSGGESLDTKLEEFLGSTANGDKRQTNVLSLCDRDYGKKLADFANDIVKRSSNTIPLKRLPNANTIRVFYGHQEIPNAVDTGWVYVPSNNTIKLGDNIAWDTTQGYNAQLRVDFEVIEQQ